MIFPPNSKPFLVDSASLLLLGGIFLLSFLYFTKLRSFFLRKFDLGLLLMAESSPIIETLDEDESSPTAPIRALVSQSLTLSSPIPQIQDQSPPQIQTLDESPSSSAEIECGDLQMMPTAQISPDSSSRIGSCNRRPPKRHMRYFDYSSDDDDDDDLNDKIFRFRSAPYSVYGDLYNHPPRRRYMPNFDYNSDDDLKMELPKPIDIFSCSSPKNKPTGVGAGLNNSGNTCFIASVLQCLTHTVPLLASLRSYKYHCPCNYFSSDFQINHQEDAHEFLQSFLDKLEKCCLDRSRRDNPPSVSSQDVNIVDHVFGGRLVSKLRCCNCNSVSETFETSPGWSLEIEDVEDLSSALESFTCVEKLEDQFTCDDCKEKVSKEKQLKFDQLPLVATFHLKRFKNNGVYMQKINKDVKFPLELDLLPYMSSNENPEVSAKYHLYAMVEHLGSGTYFGHYSAYVRSAPETWHHFDDEKVRRISEEWVLSKSAYMLFYAREGTPCFASAFEELKTLFEATPINFSPKSVLETTTTCSEECVSDLSYQTVSDSSNACKGSVGVSIPCGNSSDYHCDEAQDEVFHSAESNSGDEYFAFDSPKADDSEKPFAATFHQEERPLYPDGNRATTDDAYVPVLKIQEQVSSPKRKAAERATICEEAFLTKRKMQKRNPFSKRQGKTFQIRREHLQNKKKREETCITNPFRSIVAAASDPKEKNHAVSYLRSRPCSSRSRLLVAALGVNVKKKKVSNIRRSSLHRNLSERQ
ncbi:hypothetical protein Bca101_077194 [Brassica carinata]